MAYTIEFRDPGAIDPPKARPIVGEAWYIVGTDCAPGWAKHYALDYLRKAPKGTIARTRNERGGAIVWESYCA